MQIVNVRGRLPSDMPNIVYCGRSNGQWQGGPLANPFVIGKDGNRDAVIEKYRRWMWGHIQAGDTAVLGALRALRGDSVLGCWCAPERCHCEVIIRAADWLLTQDLEQDADEITERAEAEAEIRAAAGVPINVPVVTCRRCGTSYVSTQEFCLVCDHSPS